MRRALLALLVAGAALLAGCGEDEETSTTAPGAETTTEAETTTAPAETAEDDEGGGEAKGSGGLAAESPRDDPETALEEYFLSGDPDLVCGELATERLLSAAYGDEKGCRQAQVPGAIPNGIEIDRIDVSGEQASATVIPDGGPNDGIETEVGLVRDGDVWLVDSLEADIPAGP